ncbi:MAG TPA: hypothetical protein VK041_06040, partial [Opitutales bacterium]|nr:hypothetical protein [Opitutales bacterium]
LDNWAWVSLNGTLSYNGIPLAEGSQFYVETGEFSHWFEITYQGSGGYNLAIQAVEGGEPPSDAFSDWASGYGLAGADAAPDASPAGDGFTNLQKFAFGLNPTVPAASLADVSRDGDLLVLRWNQRAGGGIDYVVETSDSLAADSWTVIPDAEPSVMSTPDVTPPAGYERVEWTVDVSGENSRAFYRASATVDASLLP